MNRVALIRRGKLLEYATVGYNSLEGIIAIGAGLIAGSVALVGFGFDSVIVPIASATRTPKRELSPHRSFLLRDCASSIGA